MTSVTHGPESPEMNGRRAFLGVLKSRMIEKAALKEKKEKKNGIVDGLFDELNRIFFNHYLNQSTRRQLIFVAQLISKRNQYIINLAAQTILPQHVAFPLPLSRNLLLPSLPTHTPSNTTKFNQQINICTLLAAFYTK